MFEIDELSRISNGLNQEWAWEAGAVLLEQISGQSLPSVEVRAAFVDATQLLNALGFAVAARQLFRSWREAGAKEAKLRQAELFLHVSASPAAAAAHTRESGGCSGGAGGERAALETIRSLFRGEAIEAVNCADQAGWFLDDPALAHGLFHGLWALFLLDEHDRAEELIARWQRKHGSAAPWSRALVRRLQASLCGARHQYVAEAEHLAAVHELEIDGNLPVQAAYTEAALVGARARAGDLSQALEVTTQWPAPPAEGAASRGPLEAYRDRARGESFLIAGESARAFAAADRAARYFYSTGHLVMTSHLRFIRVLAASPDQFPSALEELREIVRRTSLARCTQRLALLDELAASGVQSLSDHHLDEFTTRSRSCVPLHRAFSPSVTMTGADLFWNRVCGSIHLRGKGPFYLERQRILARTLEVLASAGGRRVPIGELFSAVWDGAYDPLLHEGKVHVTVHRLRKWLEERTPEAAQLIEVTDGAIGFRRHADVRMLMPTRAAPPAPDNFEDRLLAAVARADGPVGARELERGLGASRSAVQRGLRSLLAKELIERHGSARATNYTAR